MKKYFRLNYVIANILLFFTLESIFFTVKTYSQNLSIVADRSLESKLAKSTSLPKFSPLTTEQIQPQNSKYSVFANERLPIWLEIAKSQDNFSHLKFVKNISNYSLGQNLIFPASLLAQNNVNITAPITTAKVDQTEETLIVGLSNPENSPFYQDNKIIAPNNLIAIFPLSSPETPQVYVIDRNNLIQERPQREKNPFVETILAPIAQLSELQIPSSSSDQDRETLESKLATAPYLQEFSSPINEQIQPPKTSYFVAVNERLSIWQEIVNNQDNLSNLDFIKNVYTYSVDQNIILPVSLLAQNNASLSEQITTAKLPQTEEKFIIGLSSPENNLFLDGDKIAEPTNLIAIFPLSSPEINQIYFIDRNNILQQGTEREKNPFLELISQLPELQIPTLQSNQDRETLESKLATAPYLQEFPLQTPEQIQLQKTSYFVAINERLPSWQEMINNQNNLSNLDFFNNISSYLLNQNVIFPSSLLAQNNASFTEQITTAKLPITEEKNNVGLSGSEITLFPDVDKIAVPTNLIAIFSLSGQETAQVYFIDRNNQIQERPQREKNPFLDPIPEIPEPQIPAVPPGADRETFRRIMKTVMSLNAQKYPYIVNTGDNLFIDPSQYNPAKSDVYTQVNGSIEEGKLTNNIANNNYSGLNRWTSSFYPSSDQFFWTLDNNTVVIETKGFHIGSFYQGRSISSEYHQKATSSTRFWGIQTAWALPPKISGLVGQENVRFTTVALEVNGTPGMNLSLPTLNFSSSWVPGSSLILFDNPDYGTTYSPFGGGSLFENLEADNAPVFVQGFPTINLKGLLDNGRSLKLGEIIPEENLQKIGLNWGNFFTGNGFSFQPITTSQAGVKAADLRYPQVGPLRSDFVPNKDLLTMLSNPYLTQDEKTLHYLNSLWWVAFGGGSASVKTTVRSQNEENWNRLSSSFSHNRTQLQYDPEAIKMTYTNIFSNPGFSYIYNNSFDSDLNQSFSSSIGLLLGIFFEELNQNNLDENLKSAHQRFEQQKSLSSLTTRATPQQRSEMNRRLNMTLSEANQSTSLNQISGSATLVGTVTPHDALVLQLRTGVYQRGIQFFGQDISDWSQETPVFINSFRNPDLGPLTYKGVNLPVEATRITPEPSNHVFNVYNIITTADGTSLVKNFRGFYPQVMTTVPFPDAQKAADMEFGLIELSKSRTRTISNNSYSGYINLPSVELSLAGSSEQFNYALAIGSWVNFFPNSAPMVNENNPNIPGVLAEPSVGFYISGRSKWLWEDLQVDSKSYQLIRHIPFVNFNWNSSPNRLNTVWFSPGYTFVFQNPDVRLLNSVAVTYTPQGVNSILSQNNQGEVVVSNFGEIQMKKSLKFKYAVEFGNETYWSTSLSFPVIKNDNFGELALGGYYRNYFDTFVGLNTRLPANAYGGVLEYTEPRTNSYVNLNLGTNGSGFEAIFGVGVRLKF
jgi:hypothetical protein